MTDQTSITVSPTLVEKNDEPNESNMNSETVQTIINPVVNQPFIQAVPTLDNNTQQQFIHNNGSILSTNQTTISQPVQLPIKIPGSQPLFVTNPAVIGSNVQTIGNPLTNQMCYILPSNTLNKQTIAQKGGSTGVSSTTAILPNLTNTDGTLIANTSSSPMITNQNENDLSKCSVAGPSSLKLIQTNNQRHLVLSTIKTETTTIPVQSATKTIITETSQVAIKNTATKSIASSSNDTTGKTTTYTAPALVTNTNQQQQLIILSPVKATNQNNKQFISSLKILPNSKLPTIAPATSATSKRVIAPAPITTKSLNSVASSSTTRPIQTTTNKNVQYISFVSLSAANQISSPTNQTKFTPIKQTNSNKINSGNTTIKPNMVQVGQKVLVNPNTIKISTTVAASSPSSTSSTSNHKKNHPTSIWMLPKQIIKMNDHSSNSMIGAKPSAKYIPIAPNPNQANNFQEVHKVSVNSGSKNAQENCEETRRKACNCTRSQCLKLYCDCFANGEFCNNCNCTSCCNNLEHEETRQKAIRLCLERNPNAFHPKIGQSHQGDVERRHTKGCCCKRSGCLKNYCECYEAKILCSDKCKCIGCKNFEESTERKTLMHLADAAEVRSAQQSIASKMHVWGPDFKPKLPVKVKSDCHPFNVLNDDILEATANCLLAQAEEAEFENQGDENIEALIMEQFGECLSQILNLAGNGMRKEYDDSDEDETMNDEND